MTHQEIIRAAYADGKRRITCPVCEGGESREQDTMSLHTSSVHLSGRCYRATCGAVVTSATFAVLATAFTPRPLRAPYRLVEAKDAWGQEWAQRQEQSTFFEDMKLAHASGFRVLTESPDTAVWQLRALNGRSLGHITRTRDKEIRTYKDVDRAVYYANGADRVNDVLFVFEDPMSAALCELPAIALLGTVLHDDVIQDIKAAAPGVVLVALDPGAEEAALKVYERLVAAGIPASFVPMAKDFKDMTVAERRDLEKVYA